MSVIVNHEVKGFNVKNNRLDGVVVENRAAGEVRTWHYDGIFVFIGLIPNSNLIKDSAEIDPYGFVITDRTLMTSLPGLFIDGDVRAGSTKTGCSSGRGSCNGGTHDSRILERKWINEAQDDQFGSAPADLR